ncbi:M1 family metallopeptidase [Amycolatopsis sp. EV170708-02-1]|uniref:M1 family metallopeptidase n=1 Tax=Amycolatopsis sp. EV170708-02-1 TaxID=2919322 RepID=UPI001F0CCB5B|nr:M1 family metallopeptidase [Amycolatopsis sp. EV170708-02-1]UMP05517.1 M1 family metallopeptidase [Amycolatopsis sp. EV170708-02-1]
MTVRIRWQEPLCTALLATTMLGACPASAVATPAPGSDGYVHVSPDGTVLGRDPYYPQDGNGGYDVDQYSLALDYAPYSMFLSGKATITATATQDLDRFDLDLRGLTVRSVTVDGVAATFRREGEHELVITPRTPLADGARFTVVVAYDGRPEPIATARGRVGWLAAYGDSAVATGQPRSAMTWFPVNDTEADKATLRVSVTVLDEFSVLGNGSQVSDVPTGYGRHTVTWSEETALAPSTAMLGIGRWEIERITLPGGRTAINAYHPCAVGKKTIGGRLPEVLDFLTGKFGDYPQSAAGGLFLDRSLGYTHGAQTRPVYGRAATIADLLYASAYQWWGAGVSGKMWRDALMPESIARYAVWLWDEKNGVDLDRRYREMVAKVRDDAAFWAPKLTDPGKGTEFAPTAKAVLMVHALRRLVGDDAFFQILAGFPAINPQGNQNWHDFELYVSAMTQRDLGEFNHAWLDGTVRPPDSLLFPGS